MKFTLRADHIELTDAEQQRLDRQLGRLKKHLNAPYDIHVEVRHDQHHRKGQVVGCRIHVATGTESKAFYADRSADTMETACDAALEVVEQELRRAHDKSKNHT